MALHQELFKHINLLQQENLSLKRKIEKMQQEIEYICLKLQYSTWEQVMSDLRKGIIVRKDQNHRRSTMKSMTQSPIQAESRIKYIKGSSETDRSQAEQNNRDSIKIEPITSKSIQQESINQILRYIDKYASNKKQRHAHQLQTFRDCYEETPRTVKYSEQTVLTSSIRNQEKAKEFDTLSNNTIKKKMKSNDYHDLIELKSNESARKADIQKNIIDEIQFNSLKPQKRGQLSDQDVLAIENTKLRKHIKQLEIALKCKQL